jgi:DNA modification methylase
MVRALRRAASFQFFKNLVFYSYNQYLINPNVLEKIVTALADQRKVSGAPQDFYRYPARFSPSFAREVIRTFTEPGEVVLDPFCGGGTAIVEAIALGRRAIGTDVSSLATFLTRTKTTALSVHDRRQIQDWLDRVRSDSLNARQLLRTEYRNSYCRNLPQEAHRFFDWVLDRLPTLPTVKQRRFVRLILLAVGQRAFDCKLRQTSRRELKAEFCDRLLVELDRFSNFTAEAAALNNIPQNRLASRRRIICRSSEGLHCDGRIPRSWIPAKLVLTSPPYPGVHVVYHRWQINGRKETPAPFWLANQRDGAGESHYLLGPRDQLGLRTYYERLRSVFSSLALMLDKESTMVQLVAFSDPSWQLPAYLETLEDVGFKEAHSGHPLKKGRSARRYWRKVPSRKWYAHNLGSIPPSREVLLLHKLA